MAPDRDDETRPSRPRPVSQAVYWLRRTVFALCAVVLLVGVVTATRTGVDRTLHRSHPRSGGLGTTASSPARPAISITDENKKPGTAAWAPPDVAAVWAKV